MERLVLVNEKQQTVLLACVTYMVILIAIVWSRKLKLNCTWVCPIKSTGLCLNFCYICFIYVCAGPANEQQRAIVQAFLHAWSAYKKYAWGHDELKPLSKSYQEWMGVGLTIVDSIDTMYIMGLHHGRCLSFCFFLAVVLNVLNISLFNT